MQKKKNSFKVLIAALLAAILAPMLVSVRVEAYDKEHNAGVVYVEEYAYGAKLIDKSGNILRNLGDVPYAHGSGFFVGKSEENPQYIVTNQHVVDDFYTSHEGEYGYVPMGVMENGETYFLYWERMELRVYYDKDDYDTAYIVEAGNVDKIDLAILKIRNATDKRHPLKLCIPTDEMIGDTVYAAGFPGMADNDYSTANSIGIDDVTVTKGSISRYVADNTGTERIEMDTQINHGNSGGPLITEEGYVVGVNTNGWRDSGEYIFYAINVSHVIELLEKNNIEYEVPEESGKAPIALIAVIVALLVVIAAIVIVLLIKKGKLSKPENRKKFYAKTKQTPVIKSMSVQHKGRAVSLDRGTVYIGRDPASCAIAYQEGTVGVSGRHCSVSYDAAAGDFVVTDLNSSYGTYLFNGQRLQPNMSYHLKSGECFYVGENANVIMVELEQ